MKSTISIAVLIFILSMTSNVFAKTVQYELNIENKPINLSGKKEVDFSLMVNGSIPAPTLEFTEGDTAEITVNNKLKKDEVSIHWHGLLLPPIMDGVPYVNTPPIYPGKSFTFRFKIRQHGTYWYHSHTSVQEQKGVYGAFVIHPKEKLIKADKDVALVLSDWSDENADSIMKNLRKDGDYYQYKKNSIRSYVGAIQEKSLKSHLYNEWIRMGGMDLSDVGYDAFLINGKREQQLLVAHPGEKIRLRIVNAAASTYFYISLGNIPMKVISADGTDIKPINAKEILIGMAETYDILFTVPEHKNYEFKITAQDVTGTASAWIGMGEKVFAPIKERPNLYASMNHGTHGEHANHQKHNDNQVKEIKSDEAAHSHHKHQMNHSMNSHEAHKMKSKMDHSGPHEMNHKMPVSMEDNVLETLTVDELKAKEKTSFSKDKKVYDLKLVLGGDMERYIWHINGKAIHQDRNININEGDVVRFTFENQTMMHHPMHLHGHFFRVLNKHGDYSPLKHTVDVPPHGTRTIEFYANEPGQWMLHCHNLYHMKTGMARVVKYTSYTPKGEMEKYDKADPHLHDHLYYNGMVEAATNHAQAFLRLSKTWGTLEGRLETREYDDLDHAEGDLFYRRWFSNFFNVIVGGTHYTEYENDKTRGVVGVGYMLPMMIETNLLVDHKGKLRFDIERKFQWTKNFYSDVDVVLRDGADTEYEISLMYAHRWDWSAGIMLTEESLGFGAHYNF